MKKIIALVAAATLAVGMVCAQVGVSVGAKGTFGMNLGSQLDRELKDSMGTGMDIKDVFMVNGGGQVYGRYNMPFHAPLGVQLGFGVTANNGAGLEAEQQGVKVKVSFSYLSLDIPLLITYDIAAGPVVIMPFVGPNFSIPVGEPKAGMEVEMNGTKMDMSDSSGMSVTGFVPGIVAGVAVGLPLGPGALMFDLSYVNDFTPVKAKQEGIDDQNLLIRRNFNISLGYELKF